MARCMRPPRLPAAYTECSVSYINQLDRSPEIGPATDFGFGQAGGGSLTVKAREIMSLCIDPAVSAHLSRESCAFCPRSAVRLFGLLPTGALPLRDGCRFEMLLPTALSASAVAHNTA